MTIVIYAAVRKEPENAPGPRQWMVSAQAVDDVTFEYVPDAWSTEFHPSWPEAMQAAYKLLADLNQKLMDEIHAERTARSTPKPAEDIHTMEATA